MKKVAKILGMALGAVVVLVLGWVVWVQATYERDFSNTPLPSITASKDPAVIAQGEYLVHAVAHCSACHGPADIVSKRQLSPDKLDLRGGFSLQAGPFGTFVPVNLTSHVETGMGSHTDGQLARAIRHGVGASGRLSAFMALAVGPMSDEDLTAIVSYLRTLPPIDNPTAPTEWGFVAKALSGQFSPRMSVAPPYVPAGAVSVERGKYLAHGPAICVGCHSHLDPMQGFQLVPPLFAGEFEAEPDPMEPGYEFVVPNLTPHPGTGIMAHWTEEQFVDRFKKNGRVYAGSKMPWENFAQMTEDDLRSIYRYLRTVEPVERNVGPSRRPVGWKPS